MSNDWGKPFTPEELAKKTNDGWGNPLLPKVTDPTPATINSTPEELAAKGWVQTARDEWEKIAPDTSPFAGSKVTLTFPDVSRNPPWLAPDEAHVEPDVWTGLGGENPTCYAWHPESGCGIIFSDRDALNEALEAEPLLVEMTHEEYDNASKIVAADWGSEPAQVWPGPMGEAVKAATIAEIEELRSERAKPQTELSRALETIMAPGFGESEPLTPDEPEHPDCAAPYAERTAPVDTFSEADGPWYVVYFGPVLYTVLAGPYDTQEDAAARLDRVWAQFEKDAAYDYSFPTRERSGLRATTVRSVYNLKGAYGKQ